MTVESNYTIATLKDWLKKSRARNSSNEKQTKNQSQFVRAIASGKIPVTASNYDWVIAQFTSINSTVCNVDFPHFCFLQDAFSGCQILPCSHKVHRECAIAMIQNGM